MADPRRTIPYVNFPAQFDEERDELMACVEQVFRDGFFVGGGAAIERFEAEMARTCGTEHAISVNSGTDALILGMTALGIGPGDEVITPPNSFVASTAAIVKTGATPVFADVLADQNIDPAAVEAAITPRTRAIMPVHLTGRIADMRRISEIAQRHGLAIIEDAAQAFGSRYDDKPAGSFGTIGCFSAHPLKNLNAAGDGGFVTTNDAAVATRIANLRNHGLVDRDTVAEWGTVSRMDMLQAAILLLRLARVDDVLGRRRRNAKLYQSLLDADRMFFPPCRPHEHNTFHTFIIQLDRRDGLKAALADAGIGTAIHYPIPIHLQPAAKTLGHKRGDFPVTEAQAGRILTLPVHQFLTEDDVRYVAQSVNAFCQGTAA